MTELLQCSAKSCKSIQLTQELRGHLITLENGLVLNSHYKIKSWFDTDVQNRKCFKIYNLNTDIRAEISDWLIMTGRDITVLTDIQYKSLYNNPPKPAKLNKISIQFVATGTYTTFTNDMNHYLQNSKYIVDELFDTIKDLEISVQDVVVSQ